MSDVFRKAMLNKLPQLPPTRAPWADEPTPDEIEELEEDEGGDGVAELGAPQMKPRTMGPSRYDTQDYSPISASDYFQQAFLVEPVNSACSFRTYYTPPSVSGSGSSESSDPRGAPGIKTQQQNSKSGTVLVCHHGGGSSGLSFAALAKDVKIKSGGEMGVLTFDCRGHGKTTTTGGEDVEMDVSRDTLLSDFVSVLETVFPDPATSPSLLLLGHSMGAAPVLGAAPLLQKKGYTIPGVIVLDVVEGTAVEALPLMKSILSKRPSSFRSVIDAIHWHVTSNSLRNPESARISVPHIIKPDPLGAGSGEAGQRQVWRTDLVGTEPCWEGWYEGLSQAFLNAKCARLLVLAGQERLDKELMVGQMQGKFQLEVMQDVGHYLHEDNPAHLVNILIAFWRRNTRVLVLPPKVGAPQGQGVEVKQVGQR